MPVSKRSSDDRYHGPAVNPMVNERNLNLDECPTCGAFRGEPCRNPRGYVVPTHRKRQPWANRPDAS